MSRILCLALSLFLFGSTASAQGDAMTELYGAGVHRYFAGDYAGADQLLSQVVDSGSLDPRAHYFRGLCRELQGGGGQPDFENGARLEVEGKRVVAVGLALSRVQGGVRTQIEKARREARVMALQQQLATQAEKRATMPPPPVPSETVEPMPSVADSTDPFGGDGLRSSDTTEDAVQPATPEVDAATDPFGDEPAPSDTPPPADAPATDPFGTPAGGTDPFGGTGGTDAGSGAAPADPFGDPAPATGGGSGNDPFGGTDPFGTGN